MAGGSVTRPAKPSLRLLWDSVCHHTKDITDVRGHITAGRNLPDSNAPPITSTVPYAQQAVGKDLLCSKAKNPKEPLSGKNSDTVIRLGQCNGNRKWQKKKKWLKHH